MKINKQNNHKINELKKELENLMQNQKWEEALEICLNIVKLDLYCPITIIRRMRKCFKKLNYTKENIKNILTPLSFNEASSMLELQRTLLLSKDGMCYIDEFKNCIKSIFTDNESISILAHAWNIFLESINGKKCNSIPTIDEIVKRRNTGRILCTSGMTWSGSGAIGCFLSEFDEIKQIPGEITALEGEHGLKDIEKKIEGRENFIMALYNFIFLHCFGIFPFTSVNIILSTRRTLSNIKLNQKSYAINASKLIQKFSWLIYYYNDIQKSQILKSISDEIISFYINYEVGNKYILFDNAIHIPSIKLVNYIDNMDIFCCIRDPRSQYLAKKYENSGFSQTPEKFCKWYKKIIDNFRKNLKLVTNNQSCVHVIEFEKFVTSESYRSKMILEQLNNSISHKDKYSKFKPWESLFNVLNYMKTKTQAEADEIAYIEQTLPKYIKEIDISTVMDVMYDCACDNQNLREIVNQVGKKKSESNVGLLAYNKSY